MSLTKNSIILLVQKHLTNWKRIALLLSAACFFKNMENIQHNMQMPLPEKHCCCKQCKWFGKSKCCTFFDRQCLKPDFMESVEQILSVLRRNGTTAAVLYETALHCNGRLHDKLQDLSYIYQQYETLLQTNRIRGCLD